MADIQMPTEAEVARTWKSPPSEYGPEPYYGLNGAVTGSIGARSGHRNAPRLSCCNGPA